MARYKILQISPIPRFYPVFVMAGKFGGKVVLRLEYACCLALVEQQGAFADSPRKESIIPFFVDMDGGVKCALDEDVMLKLVRISPQGLVSFDNEPDLAKAKILIEKLEAIEKEIETTKAEIVPPPPPVVPKEDTIGDRPNARFLVSDQWGETLYEGTFAGFSFVSMPPSTPISEAHERIEKYTRERSLSVKWKN